MKLSHLRRQHADLNLALLQRNRDLFSGGIDFAKRVSAYLPQNDQEPASVYAKRCGAAADSYMNYCSPVINHYASWLLTSKPEVTSEPEELDEFYDIFREDCDAKGTDLDHFARHRFVDSLLDQRSFWRVEFPENADLEPDVLSEWKNSGLGQAALVPILAASIINWKRDAIGYVWMVEYDCHQGYEEPDDAAETVCECWTIWSRDGEHRRYELRYTTDQKPSGDIEVPEVELVANWGQIAGIPIVELCLPEELWLMNLIAGPQLENWRKRVGLSWSIDRTNYAMPVFKMKNRQKPPKMGVGYYLMIGNEDEVSYLSPPADTFKTTQEYVDNIKDELHRVTQQMARGVDNNAAAVGRSGDSKDADDRQTEIVLSGFGAYVRDALERTYDLVAEGRGEDVVFSVGGLDTYHITDATSFIANAQIAATIPIPSVTHNREMAKHLSRIQMPDLDEGKRQDIDDEIDESISDESMAAETAESPEDLSKKVDYTTKAANAGLLSQKTAVKHLAGVFGHDPATESKAISKEAKEADDYGPMLGKGEGGDPKTQFGANVGGGVAGNVSADAGDGPQKVK